MRKLPATTSSTTTVAGSESASLRHNLPYGNGRQRRLLPVDPSIHQLDLFAAPQQLITVPDQTGSRLSPADASATFAVFREVLQRPVHATRFRLLAIRALELMFPGTEHIDLILKRPGEEGWPCNPRPVTIAQAATLWECSDLLVGIRPERQLRVLFGDVDRHQASTPSRYWHADGQSPELLNLEHQAIDAGAQHLLFRSSGNGGLRPVVLLPEPIKAHVGHHVINELAARSGLEAGGGQWEVFPSELRWRSGFSSDSRPRSNGVRLMAQPGSAIRVGDRWIEDRELQLEMIIGELEALELTDTWQQLLKATQPRVDAQFNQGRLKVAYGKGLQLNPWTGPAETNDRLPERCRKVIADHPTAHFDQMVELVQQLCESDPSFQQHASAESKALIRRGTWVAQWLRCTLKGFNPGQIAVRPSNPHHNRDEQLRVETLLFKLAQGAADACEWSQRKVAELSGLARGTVRKWWGQWQEMTGLEEVVHTPPIKPLHTGSAEAETEGRDLAVGSDSIKSLDPVPPAPSAETVTCGVIVETQAAGLALLAQRCQELRARLFPVKAAGSVDPPPGSKRVVVLSPEEKRERERAELEAWLANTA